MVKGWFLRRVECDSGEGEVMEVDCRVKRGRREKGGVDWGV